MLGHRDIAVIGEAPAVYERHTGFAERTLDGLRARARELGLRRAAPPVRGRVRRDGGDPGPDPRRAAGHHGVRRAERVRGRTAARAAAAAGPGRARGRLGGRGLPGPGRRAGLGAADVGRHPRAGDGPAGRGAADRQARRARDADEVGAARPRADGPGEHGAAPHRPPVRRHSHATSQPLPSRTASHAQPSTSSAVDAPAPRFPAFPRPSHALPAGAEPGVRPSSLQETSVNQPAETQTPRRGQPGAVLPHRRHVP